jgi:hypothetical protein
MAQLLELFEKSIEPHVPEPAAQKFKSEVRRKVNALAVDACDVMNLDENTLFNGAAQDVRDRMLPDGAAQRATTPRRPSR